MEPAMSPDREGTDPPEEAGSSFTRQRGGRSARRSASRTERRLARRRRVLIGLAVLVAGLAVAAAVVLFLRRPGGSPPAAAPASSGSPTDGDPQPSLVLVTRGPKEDGPASLVTVLAYDRASGEGTILLVPAGVLTDIPGHGLLPLGRAYEFGQLPLLDTTLDNLLGVDLDHGAAVTQQGWASFLGRTGGLTVDVRQRLTTEDAQGNQVVRFRPGAQTLPGDRLAELLTFREAGEPGLSRLPRVQQVLMALFDGIGRDPSLTGQLFADGAPMLQTDAPRGFVRDLFASLGQAAAEDKVTVLTLPVSPIGTAADAAYRIDTERTREMIGERLAASTPSADSGEVRDLQILNGNGVPGIGQAVAKRLVPAGFRVVLTGNADRFDHAQTRIIVYADDAAHLRAAEQIRTLLGVGTVELGRTPQSVVDITVVVGKDFSDTDRTD